MRQDGRCVNGGRVAMLLTASGLECVPEQRTAPQPAMHHGSRAARLEQSCWRRVIDDVYTVPSVRQSPTLRRRPRLVRDPVAGSASTPVRSECASEFPPAFLCLGWTNLHRFYHARTRREVVVDVGQGMEQRRRGRGGWRLLW